jgi:hypothetical protein
MHRFITNFALPLLRFPPARTRLQVATQGCAGSFCMLDSRIDVSALNRHSFLEHTCDTNLASPTCTAGNPQIYKTLLRLEAQSAMTESLCNAREAVAETFWSLVQSGKVGVCAPDVWSRKLLGDSQAEAERSKVVEVAPHREIEPVGFRSLHSVLSSEDEGPRVHSVEVSDRC